MFGAICRLTAIGDQERDGGRVDWGSVKAESLGDGQFVGDHAIELKRADGLGDVSVGRLEEVVVGKVWRERERVTEKDAEEVAFRRHVVRGSHGREGLGFGGVGALGQDALR